MIQLPLGEHLLSAGHCAFQSSSYLSILPIVQKIKPRLRGAKQVDPNARAGNKLGITWEAKFRNTKDGKFTATCLKSNSVLLQSTYLNTCVPTSSFPIFQTGLGTGGNSRPVCWWRWGVEALGGRILTIVLVPGSSHPSLPQTIHLLVPGLVEDKKVKEVISRCDSGESQ